MIAVKGMEMPKGCHDCPMCLSNDEEEDFCCITNDLTSCLDTERLDTCPLVPVITCKDCKYFERLTCLGGQCVCPTTTYINETTNDFYCKDGEKRE